MTPIRPLQRADLPAVADLYAGFNGWDAAAVRPALVACYARTMLDGPAVDPEIPALVYDDPCDGVVGVIGSNVRPFKHGDRDVRVACSGPLVVHPAHRPRGLGALLLRQYLAGAQDLTANDRAADQVHAMWAALGGETWTAASVGWSLVVAPAGFVAGAISRRALGRDRPPGATAIARADAIAARRLAPAPREGSSEPLSHEALIDLVERLARSFPLRPRYDDALLAWLVAEMEAANVPGRLVRRLVRRQDGRAVGSFVAYVAPHGIAELMQLAAADRDVELVLDHLVHGAAVGGAVELRGRFEPHLLPALRRRRCRTVPVDWSLLHSRDRELLAAVQGGRGLVSRLDGEWWLRPDPGTVV